MKSEMHARLEAIFVPLALEQRNRFLAEQADPSCLRFVHYTSAKAALSIINSKRLWMRNVTAMDDFREVQHGFDILNGIVSDAHIRESLNGALDACAPGAAEEAIAHFNTWWNDIRFNTFVTSVSEHVDTEDMHGRLSMWRAFGGGEPRVAIVFKVPLTALDLGVLNLVFSPVAYLTKPQMETEFRRVIANVNSERDFLRTLSKEDIVQVVFNMLVSAVSCLKHEGFKEEREWRLIYAPKRWPSDHIERSTEIVRDVPQIVYKVPVDEKKWADLKPLDLSTIFDRLILGPSQYPWSMIEAFFDALRGAGVDSPNIRASEIPLRSR
jgi:hypothetical protein